MNQVFELQTFPEGIALLRNGKPLMTPGRQKMILPHHRLAEAVAEEWLALDDDRIDPARLPLTGFAALTLDRIIPQREEITAELVEYGETDLLCYREAEDPVLQAEQDKQWQPWLDWAEKRYLTRYQVTYGVTPIVQDPNNAASHAVVLQHLTSWRLASLAVVTKLSTSLILGLAFVTEALDAEALFTLSRLEETHNTVRWGMEPEAAAKAASLHAEMQNAQRWRDLLTEG